MFSDTEISEPYVGTQSLFLSRTSNCTAARLWLVPSSTQITDDDDKNGKEKLALLSPLISEGIYEIRLPR